MAAALWYSSLKGKPVLQEGGKKARVRTCYFKTLNPSLDNLAFPLAEQTALAVVLATLYPPCYQRVYCLLFPLLIGIN